MAYNDYARCTGCKAKIEFALNPVTGKRVPLNLVSETSAKDPMASWAVWDNPAGGYFTRPITKVEPFFDESEHLAVNHLVVCPERFARHSRSRRRNAASRT